MKNRPALQGEPIEKTKKKFMLHLSKGCFIIFDMKIGYIRVSDDEHTEALQVDALKAAGCEAIYADHGVSGLPKGW